MFQSRRRRTSHQILFLLLNWRLEIKKKKHTHFNATHVRLRSSRRSITPRRSTLVQIVTHVILTDVSIVSVCRLFKHQSQGEEHEQTGRQT